MVDIDALERWAGTGLFGDWHKTVKALAAECRAWRAAADACLATGVWIDPRAIDAPVLVTHTPLKRPIDYGEAF